MSNNLQKLYSLRKNFSIIGLTGRTGSGCSETALKLSKGFYDLKNIRDIDVFNSSPSVFSKKIEIVKTFSEKNWKEYRIIEYKKVLLFILLPKLYSNPKNELLKDYYKDKLKEDPDLSLISSIKTKIQSYIHKYDNLIKKIIELGDLSIVKNIDELKIINDIFWGEDFNKLASLIDEVLVKNGLTRRVMLLHHVAANFRRSGQPFMTNDANINNIYNIASVINRIIKATKQQSDTNECHIVIDSLRNSLEINFFKERYSAFYLVAVKNDRRRAKLMTKYPIVDQVQDIITIDRLLEMDDVEYKSSDFQKGIFYSPDVQNCIQIADYHINNNYHDDDFATTTKYQSFYSLDEQLIKLQSLIQQPGIITPDPPERVMQLAYTAKLNSGCISRQVGAVVTDKEFSTKAIGWNDVPKGALPCSLRNVKNIFNEKKSFGFTDFELGKGLKETENLENLMIQEQEVDNESKEYNSFIKANYNELSIPTEKLEGRNCPYCFKTAYNTFSGEKNQVHTRSLHAEENAMMQISKYGGQGLKNGFLFTTASPCELCAKKAYQLGIETIYFIDPYPGISRNHILKSNKDKDPKMVLFSGAVGRAYHKLYEPFMAQKDELTLLTDFKLESPNHLKTKQIKSIISDGFNNDPELSKKLDDLLKDNATSFDKLIDIIKKGLSD